MTGFVLIACWRSIDRNVGAAITAEVGYKGVGRDDGAGRADGVGRDDGGVGSGSPDPA